MKNIDTSPRTTRRHHNGSGQSAISSDIPSNVILHSLLTSSTFTDRDNYATMASPASSTGEDQKKNAEQITFRFCSEWYARHSLFSRYFALTYCSSNMLYPKEDPDTHRLQFACRTCQYSEEATSSCVFRNILNNAVGETAGVTQDVGSDPTVGLPLCLLCGSVLVCEGRMVGALEDELFLELIPAKMQKL
jgi:DNA-directed RNA polymerase II subunit RPB9